MKKQKQWKWSQPFYMVEDVSGLKVKKVYTTKAHRLSIPRPVFIILGRELVLPAMLNRALPNVSDPNAGLLALTLLADALPNLLEQETQEIDLDADVRFQMKMQFQGALNIIPDVEGTCDRIRLVQAGSEVYIFDTEFVLDFHKTDKGYTWKWAK